MVGQAAEQIIAGVVLSERLAVTMYGAIHRAQFAGQRNLRGLIIDPKLLAEAAFRATLTDPDTVATAIALDHPNIVPTVAVESGGPDVVIVTRGVGRYVTVQDLLISARANRSQAGKLSIPIAAAIARSAIEALAAAHRAQVVHGAVHPRSVLIDEDGGVRLGDFVAGRALTTAVARGVDPAMWRGLAGHLAPEVVSGENPSPAADVFAVGAMLFTMLSGDIPPGNLRVTPAVERLVQRALDTDLARRYRNASDLLENLLEAFEDDRWELADRGEVVSAAGLSQTDTAIDEATEDLLASLAGPGGVQITAAPIRPGIERVATPVPRAEPRLATAAPAPLPVPTPPPSAETTSAGLDALLADLESPEHTAVEARPFERDPISEVIAQDPRRADAIAPARPRAQPGAIERGEIGAASSRLAGAPGTADGVVGRVGDRAVHGQVIDEPDEDTPLPLPLRDSDPDLRLAAASAVAAAAASAVPAPAPASGPATPPSPSDESAAMAALAGLDDPVRRVSSVAEQAAEAAERLEQAARRARAAAEVAARSATPLPIPRPAATPVTDVPVIEDLPPVRLRSRALGIVSLLVVIGGAIAFYFAYRRQEAAIADARARDEEKTKDAEQRTRELIAAQPDRGSIRVTTSPSEASVWLKLGRTNLDTLPLTSSQRHRLRIELPGYQPVDTEVVAANWEGTGAARKARVAVTLKAAPIDKRTRQPILDPLPALPPNLAEQTGFTAGEGPLHIETSPPGAEVWLLIGYGNPGAQFPTIAGRAYELRALADGYRPGYASITVDEWRDPKGDPRAPIDVAPKKDAIEKRLALEVDPDARPPGQKPRK